MRSLLAMFLLAGCELTDSTELLDHVEQAASCSNPGFACQSNSPVIELRWFHEAHERGIPNDAGFAIKAFRVHGHEHTLDVAGGRLHARRGTTTIAGGDLEGAQISLDLDGVPSYVLRIAAVGSVPYWSTGTTKLLETYLIEWTGLDADGAPHANWRNLCSQPPVTDSDTLGMNSLHVLLFEGDRIDAQAKTVYGVDRGGEWFNFGCAGGALAKLALSGHTEPAVTDGFATKLDERQAMLKMLAGDYCGDGTPFTVGGQPLYWRDHAGWLEYPNVPESIEARWTASGAACLEEPRVKANPSALATAEFPDIERAIADHCKRPPPCKNRDAYTFEGYEHLISANP
jgi:hypothetical protein